MYATHTLLVSFRHIMQEAFQNKPIKKKRMIMHTWWIGKQKPQYQWLQLGSFTRDTPKPLSYLQSIIHSSNHVAMLRKEKKKMKKDKKRDYCYLQCHWVDVTLDISTSKRSLIIKHVWDISLVSIRIISIKLKDHVIQKVWYFTPRGWLKQ